jgi:hypothetical protein
LNSSISATILRISGVIVMFLISCMGSISIFTHFQPLHTQKARNTHSYPFTPVSRPNGCALVVETERR